MADHRRKAGGQVPGEASCASRAGDEGPEDTGSAESGDAERKARGPVGVLSHRIRNLRRFGGGNEERVVQPHVMETPGGAK